MLDKAAIIKLIQIYIKYFNFNIEDKNFLYYFLLAMVS